MELDHKCGQIGPCPSPWHRHAVHRKPISQLEACFGPRFCFMGGNSLAMVTSLGRPISAEDSTKNEILHTQDTPLLRKLCAALRSAWSVELRVELRCALRFVQLRVTLPPALFNACWVCSYVVLRVAFRCALRSVSCALRSVFH